MEKNRASTLREGMRIQADFGKLEKLSELRKHYQYWKDKEGFF